MKEISLMSNQFIYKLNIQNDVLLYSLKARQTTDFAILINGLISIVQNQQIKELALQIDSLVQRMQQAPKIPEKIGKNYKIIRKIDKGSFSEIYLAINIKANIEVAVKVQPIISKHPQLIYECKLYNYLHKDQKVEDKGIPNIYYCSTQGAYNVLVMDLMGPSLEQLFQNIFRKFSLKTVLMLVDQMFSRIAYVHKRLFLHRDIKPANFCIGLNKSSHKIFLIDFGLAQRYQTIDRQYPPHRQCLNGTPRYASINSHLGIEQRPRDDMESIAYVLMEFLRGQLPWQGLKAHNKKEKYQKIKQKKIKTSIEQLCKGYPIEFTNYLNYCRNLGFAENPDYSFVQKMFKDLFQKNGYKYDYRYDWVIFNQKQQQLIHKDTK